MSLNYDYNSLNPPPNAPTIPGSVNLNSATVSYHTTRSVWPGNPFNSTITSSTNIDYTTNPFTFIRYNVATPVQTTLSRLPTGTVFVVQVSGVGNVTIRSRINTVLGVDQYISTNIPMTTGTYIVSVFGDSLVYNSLTNPTAV